MSPLARAVRTFLAGIAGVTTAAASINWLADYRVGAVQVGLGLLAALIAALSAFFLAYKDVTASTPVGKAFAQFAQMIGGGLAAVAINAPSDLAPQGRVVLTLLITSALSAFATFFLNASEQGST